MAYIKGFPDLLPRIALMMIECPYSTKTREILANPKKYLEMSLGFHGRDISRVSGNLSGVGDGFPNTSLVSMEHGYS